MTNELKRYLKNKKNLEDAFLYNPEHEHDSCGVGFVASTDGKQRREVVQGGIDALKALRASIPPWTTSRLCLPSVDATKPTPQESCSCSGLYKKASSKFFLFFKYLFNSFVMML